MRTILCGLLLAFSFCLSPALVHANDYKSAVITLSNTIPAIDVPHDRFLVIRSFTQSGGTTRGLVTVTMLNGQSENLNVLSASMVPADNTQTIEPVNSIVIAGPATVSVTCPDASATCFVSYRKESE